ncbi:MAG: ABC transporter substrate-binding protein [Butyricicoccus pullicaecorum]|nr:ABC transporter substrate-binding protein [Butyricicoccus pullicaecorum]
MSVKYPILWRIAVCGTALSLLTGCTLTERLDTVPSGSIPNAASRAPHGAIDMALPYYTAEKVNPITSTSSINRIVCEALYEGVFVLNEQFQPEPLLCERYELEGTRCTLVLKEGLLFSDGSPVTAEDVVASYRLAQRTPTSPYHDRTAYMSSIRAVDSRTVRITLTAANSRFLSLLDIPILKKGTENNTFAVGTGAFAVTEQEGEPVLLPNAHWHGGPVRTVTQIGLVGTVRPDAVTSSFAVGDISMTRAERICDNPITIKGAVDVYQTPTTELHYLGIRASHPLLANENFRKALSLAIDRDMLCKSSLQTFADPAVLPINPQPDNQMSGSLKQANTYLRQMGIEDKNGDGRAEDANGNPISLTLLCNSENTFKRNVCSQLVTFFSHLGIELRINAVPFAQYQAALTSGMFDLYYGDVLMTPDFDLRALLMTGGSLNFGRFSDITLDQHIMTVRTASAETLPQAEAAFEEYFLAKMPILPLAFERDQVIVRSGLLANFNPRPYNMFWAPTEWRLE